MVEITSRNGTPRQSIAPSAPSAEGAPTITTRGAQLPVSPVSPSSREREAELQKEYADIESEYGRSKYLRSRRGEMKLRPAPATPVSDEYVIVIRGKTPKRQRMLSDLVIGEEQLARERWLGEETVRAAVLPEQLRQQRAYLAQLEYINKASQEHAKAVLERQAAIAEAEKYGYHSPEALQAAIWEEKAIKHANELGRALAETQIVAQTVAREGYGGALTQLGRDPGELIAEQQAIAKAAESHLESFGIKPEPQREAFLQEASAFATKAAAAPTQPEPKRAPIIDEQLGFQITYAGPLPGAGKYPPPPSTLAAAAVPVKLGTTPILAPVQRTLLIDEQLGLQLTYVGPLYVEGEWPAPPSTTPMYEAAIEAGLTTAPIVGFSEKIQTTGTEWIEEHQAASQWVVEQRFPEEGIPKTIAGGMADIGIGAWRAPISIAAIGLAIPSGIETAVRYPKEFGAAFVPAMIETGKGLVSYAKEEPLQFVGEMVASGLMLHGAGKVAKPVTKPVVSKITETSIKIRTPPEHRPAVGAVSDIGRYVPKLRSTIEMEPDLSRVLNIGKAGPIVEDVLAAQPHTIYGSTVQLGQMPIRRIPSIPKDLDVFIQNPQEFAAQMAARLGPEYIAEGNLVRRIVGPELKPHAIDTHAFPPGYPMEGAPSAFRVAYGAEEAAVAPRLPFDFMPTEVLRGPRLTQEYLYTQVGRKATSVIGEPEGRWRWRFGPEEHRLKDIPTLIADAEWLVESGRQQLPQMGIVGRVMTGRKVRKIEDAIDVLRQDPLIKRALIEPTVATEEIPTITLYPRPSKPKTIPSGYVPLALAPAATAVSPRTAYPRARTPSRPAAVSPSLSPAVRVSPPSDIPVSRPSRQAVPSRPGISVVPSIPKLRPSREEPSVAPVSPSIFALPKYQPSPYTSIPSVPPSRQVVSRQVVPTIRPSRPPITPSPVRPSPPPITRSIPRGISDETRRSRWGEEFYIHYAERPTPHARLEEAYTDLPGPRIRPAKMVRNIQRIVLGEPPKTPPRAVKVIRPGPQVVRRARQKVPWEIAGLGIGLGVGTEVANLSDLVFGTPGRKRKKG